MSDYPYINGFILSQVDIEIYQSISHMDISFQKYPHLHRWYNHIKTFNSQEISALYSKKSELLSKRILRVPSKRVEDFQVEKRDHLLFETLDIYLSFAF